MNQNQYCKIIIILTFIAFGLAGSIQPVQVDKKEILTISEKRRSYFQLHKESLTYEINGPKNLQIVCRRAVPEKDEKLWKFGYRIFIDDQTPVTVRHEEEKSKGVRSSQHPGHGYTQSGKYLLKVPKGAHVVKIEPLQVNSAPVLLRMITKKIQKPDVKSTFVDPEGDDIPFHVIVGKKIICYHELNSENPLVYNFNGPTHVEFINRLIFADWMTGEEPYRIRLWKGDEVLGTYYFSSERSDLSAVKVDKTIVPGKWRSSVVELDNGPHRLKLEMMDKGKRVFIRALATDSE
jgi:hypothetical protein